MDFIVTSASTNRPYSGVTFKSSLLYSLLMFDSKIVLSKWYGPTTRHISL